MLNEPLPVGRRVVHRSAPGFSGVVVQLAVTARGRQLASVRVDGEDEPRIFDAAMLISMTTIGELEARRQAVIAAYRQADTDAEQVRWCREQIDLEDSILAAVAENRAGIEVKIQIWRALIEDPASIFDRHLPLFDQFVAELAAA